jgi:hypothetical protein
MRTIKIINGTFGYRRPGRFAITPIQKDDPPIEVEDALAARLAVLGVAAYVDTMTAELEQSGGFGSPKRNPERTLLEKTRRELDTLAAELGLDTSKCQNKAEAAALILAAQTDDGMDNEEDDGMDNEDAPPNPDAGGDIVT